MLGGGGALTGSSTACATGISFFTDGGVLAGLILAGVLEVLLEAGQENIDNMNESFFVTGP